MSSAAILSVCHSSLIDLLTIGFRLLEIVLATIIAGVNVANVRRPQHSSGIGPVRGGNAGNMRVCLIYTEAVAGVASLLAVVLVLGLRAKFTFPVDFVLFVMWMVAFGLLIDFHDGMYVKFTESEQVPWTDPLYITDAPLIVVFCILSSIAWLASGFVNIIRYVVVHNARLSAEKDTLPDSAPVTETAPIDVVVV